MLSQKNEADTLQHIIIYFTKLLTIYWFIFI